ncbi:MAG: hypothetical protein E7029_08100 [Planctomycetaceae bacterium]|nr:hypothetical protein [Planctomycetaceae bacterium]
MPSTRRDFLHTCSALTGAAILSSSGQTDVPAAAADDAVSADGAISVNDAVSANAAAQNAQTEVGAPYAGWKEGEMDLHFILTGVGESMFHIYPDGTTLLLDAPDWNIERYPDRTPALPDTSRIASEWIMRYLTRVNPGGRSIDYMMLSHYHNDHAGCAEVHAGKTQGRGEDYFLSGLANIGEHFKFTKVFDRGFPAYDQPKAIQSDGFVNFVRFTKYMTKAGRFAMEELEVGRQDQLALCRTPEKFPNFHTRTICRNGVVWTGKEMETRNFYAENEKNTKGHINENTLSIGFLIEYGPFRYFTGGDLSCSVYTTDDERINLEAYVGSVIGKLDVCKTNHHAYKDSMDPGFTNAVQAKVYVSNVWDLHHLQDNTMTNMTSAAENVLVCPTICHARALEKYRGCAWMKNLAPEAHDGGHVVVKVFDEGRQYKVYYLTAKDESMTVRQVYGPFRSRNAGEEIS